MSSTSDALLALINQFNSTPSYTAKSDAELRAQAANEYASYYGNLRLSAKQAHDRNTLALQQSRDNLAKSYDKQREASAQQYASAYSQTDRQMLGRGMQRSSYGSQTLANLLEAGAQAQQDIYDAQTDAERQIDSQIALLAQQLSEQLMQYDASEQSDILARLWTLQQQEYDRGVAAQDRQNSLAAQIYQYQYQEGRDQVADSQWQQQYDESVRQWQEEMDFTKQQYDDSQAKKTSGSTSTGSTASGAATGTTSAGTGSMTWADFVNMLGGSTTGAATTTTTTTTPSGTGGLVGLINTAAQVIANGAKKK